MQVGIEAAGAYLPYTRLPLAVIHGRGAKAGGPEKAIAWYDEDAITLAVAAARNCLAGIDRHRIDGLILASTSLPYAEKQGASIVARALDLRTDIRTADLTGSLRAGTSALQQAFDMVGAGGLKAVLVVAADCRMAAPRSTAENDGGDGAAAVLVSAENLKAEGLGFASVSNEMMDIWRRPGDRFIHSWEDRFVKQHGYTDVSVAAVTALCDQLNTRPDAFDRCCLYAPDARSHAGMAAKLSVAKDKLQPAWFGKLGNTGASFSLIQLVAAMESADIGDRLMVTSYGDGADAMALRVLAHAAPHQRTDELLARRRTIKHYDSYLSARGMTTSEYPEADDQGISATVQYRNRDENLSLAGQVCTGCGTHQFPKGRVCGHCGSLDQWQPARYADDRARLLTYTRDAFYPAPEPPTLAGIVEVERADGSPGPRFHMQVTECASETLHCGMSLQFVFRCIHKVGQRPNYFWKCIPNTQAVNTDEG